MMIFYMNPILIAAAVIPALVLLIRIYLADKIEEEPPGLLLSLIIYGVVATALAVTAERAGTALLPLFANPGTVQYNALMYFVVIAFSEEGFKYLLLKEKPGTILHLTISLMGWYMQCLYHLGLHYGKILAM